MTAQFVFSGEHGTYSVPVGESRLGSDAACDICIRGEGVFPVHAYLRVDGAKLLVRPADNAGSADIHRPVVSVNGQALSGPTVLLGGEQLAVAAVQLRLTRKRVSLWQRRWFRRSTYACSCLAALLLIGFLILKFVLLDPARLKEKLALAVQTHLLREETDVKDVQVNLFQGTIELSELRIKERHNFSGSSTPFLKVRAITLKMSAWQMLGCCTDLPRAWFQDLSGLELLVDEPEMVVQRSKADGAFSIDDIVAKFRTGSVELGLEKISFKVRIKDALVKLSDSIGDSSLEEINVSLVQPGAGEPLVIEECRMRANSHTATEPGRLEVKGQLRLISDDCLFDTARLSSVDDLNFQMQNFDLARLFEHLGYAWEPHGLKFKVVLGKPISGQVSVRLDSPRRFALSGRLDSDSLLSLREEGKPPLGNIPMRLEIAHLEFADNEAGFRPQVVDMKLRCGATLDDSRAAYLVCDAIGRLNPGGASEYSIRLQHCDLEALCGTDVGQALGLQGRLGGRLDGTARMLIDAAGRLTMSAGLQTSQDSYVLVSDSSAGPNGGGRAAAVKQPLPLKFDCHASARPGTGGVISNVDIESFSLTAPSIEARSTVHGWLRGLGPNEKLAAYAQFKLDLKGREFWNEFAPILDLFGLNKPIQETLNLTVTVDGKDDLVSLAAGGTAARQWGADPAPVELAAVIDYNGKAVRSGTEAQPYMVLELAVSSARGKPLNLRLKANCHRSEKTETVIVEGYDRQGKMPLLINSDIVTLRERFKPYIEAYLAGLDGDAALPHSTWLALYADTVLGGELEQSGRIEFRRQLDRKSNEPDRVDFDLAITGKGLILDMPFRLRQPDKPAPGRFVWDEPAPVFRMKGSYQQRLSEDREQPSRQRLSLEKLEVKGRLGEFRLELADLDLFKLINLRTLPRETWTDVVGRLTISGQVSPPACDLLRVLRLLPQDHPLSGTLALQVAFDRERDTLDLQKFAFRQTDTKREFFLLNLDINGSLVRMRELSKQLLPATAAAPPFTHNLLTMAEEGGPAAFLDHLGETLQINALQVESQPLVQWLCSEYQTPNKDKPPPALVVALLNKDWQPEGTWKAYGVRLLRTEAKSRKYSLVGALLRTDLTCFAAPATAGAARVPALSFSHDWRLMMGLAVSGDNSLALNGDIVLDDAFLLASYPQLEFEYRKPAKEPCKIEISDFSYSHGLLALLGKLKLTSKPLVAEIANFELRDFGPPGGRAVASIKEVLIGGGPLPCAISIDRFEPGADSISLRVDAPKAELAYLARVCGAPAELQSSGRLKDLKFSYRGSVIGLQTMWDSDPARAAAKFPRLQPGDPRLSGLNPESDRLEINAQLDGVNLAFARPEQKTVALRLGGGLQLTTRDLSWKDMSLEASLRDAEDKALSTLVAFTVPALQVNSLDPKLNLARAFKAPGMPIGLNANVALTTPLNVERILAAPDALMSALGIASSSNTANEKRLGGFEKLWMSGSFRTPAFTLGELVLTNFQAQDCSLKNLRLVVPAVSAEACGGKLAFSDCIYDLSMARCVESAGKMTLKGLKHEQRLDVRGMDLAKLLGMSASGGYSLAGKVDAKGDLKGVDFAPNDRLTWKGALKLQLSDLLVSAPKAAQRSSERLAPWASYFLSLGDKFAKPVGRISGSDTLSVRDFAEDLPVEPSEKIANALLLALHVYLSKAYALDLPQYEFEPVTRTISISEGGIANFEACQLVGKNRSSGLEVLVKNAKVSLTTETFSDDNAEGTIVQVTSIPMASRQKLHLDDWPAGPQGDYLNGLDKGRLPLRIYGRLAAPVLKMPWAELRSLSRRALFDVERIDDLEALEKARKFATRVWGTKLDAAAELADRTGVGLPSTVAAYDQGENVIGRVQGLPQSLQKLLPLTNPPITPRESLDKLLNPEPDVKPPPLGTKVNGGAKPNP